MAAQTSFDQTDPRLAKALQRVAPLLPASPTVQRRLGGLTNANYLITAAAQNYVLRIPGAGTRDYINRAHEAVAARATAAIFINAPLLHFDPATGLQLTGFIEGLTMSEAGFKSPAAVARAAIALRAVHTGSATFANRFDVFSMIDNYLAVLKSKNAALPPGYGSTLAEILPLRPKLHGAAIPLAPCHCDPLAENFVDTGEKMHILDWEYSGNNDPLWDLADLCIEARFDAAQEKNLIHTYFDGPPPPPLHARLILYKTFCNILWTLWATIQVANGNTADNFWAYATGRLADARATMATPEFAWAEKTAFA
jgi:thiamine kinase-like enzyme